MKEQFKSVMELVEAYRVAAEERIVRLAALQRAQADYYTAAVKEQEARTAAEEALDALQE
jgi:hypothetical protein